MKIYVGELNSLITTLTAIENSKNLSKCEKNDIKRTVEILNY